MQAIDQLTTLSLPKALQPHFRLESILFDPLVHTDTDRKITCIDRVSI